MSYQVIDQIEEKQRIIENLEAEASKFDNEVLPSLFNEFGYKGDYEFIFFE